MTVADSSFGQKLVAESTSLSVSLLFILGTLTAQRSCLFKTLVQRGAYLFIVGHGAPWQLIQVAMRVGLRLPLGKQTGWTWHARDDVRKDITAAGNVTSWQLRGRQWDKQTMRSSDDNNGGQIIWKRQAIVRITVTPTSSGSHGFCSYAPKWQLAVVLNSLLS